MHEEGGKAASRIFVEGAPCLKAAAEAHILLSRVRWANSRVIASDVAPMRSETRLNPTV